MISISKKLCRYGLLLPKKTQPLHRVLQKPSVFGNDSDDDEVRKPIYLLLHQENIFKTACRFVLPLGFGVLCTDPSKGPFKESSAVIFRMT